MAEDNLMLNNGKRAFTRFYGCILFFLSTREAGGED
jgi:hypothetical protein